MLPDTVHHHSRGQRMIGLSQPARECQPTATGPGFRVWRRPLKIYRRDQRRQYAGFDWRSRSQCVATSQQWCHNWPRLVIKRTQFIERDSLFLLLRNRRVTLISPGSIVDEHLGQLFIERLVVRLQEQLKLLGEVRFDGCALVDWLAQCLLHIGPNRFRYHRQSVIKQPLFELRSHIGQFFLQPRDFRIQFSIEFFRRLFL